MVQVVSLEDFDERLAAAASVHRRSEAGEAVHGTCALPAGLGTATGDLVRVARWLEFRHVTFRAQAPFRIRVGEGAAFVSIGCLQAGAMHTESAERAWRWQYPRDRLLVRASDPGGSVSTLVPPGEPTTIAWLRLDPSRLRESIGADRDGSEAVLPRLLSDDGQVIGSWTPSPEIRLCLAQIRDYAGTGALRADYMAGKAIELATLFAAEAPERLLEASSSHPLGLAERARIERACAILNENLAQPPTIAELAREVRLSPTTLKAGFRRLYGRPIYAYLREERLERARALLACGGTSVSDVAGAVGYACKSRFAIAFRARYGVRPGAYRTSAPTPDPQRPRAVVD